MKSIVAEINNKFIFPDTSQITLDKLEESNYTYTGNEDDPSRMEYNQLLSKDIYIGHQQLYLENTRNFGLQRNTDIIQMIFVLKGSYYLKSNKETIASIQSLEHNMIYLTEGLTEVIVHGEEELEFIEIQLSIAFVERYISASHELHNIISSGKSACISERNMQGNSHIQGVLHDLIKCELGGNLKSLYIRAKVIEILSLQLAQYDSSELTNMAELSDRDIEKMNIVKELITSSPDKTYSLAYLARQAGTNEQYLKSHFKKVYGKTVFNYLTAYRMELAKELLISGNKKIADIALEVGYRHSTHFTQAFKKYFGYLPLKIRGTLKLLAYITVEMI